MFHGKYRAHPARSLWRKLCVHFGADERGQVVLTFALALVPVSTAVGVAVDYSRANSVKVGMQAALDAALISVAKDTLGSSNDVTSMLTTRFQANLRRPEAQNIQVTSSYDSNGALSAQATATVAADFFGLVGLSTMNVGVRAKASAATPKGCVLALDRTAAGAVSIQGSASVQLKGCALYDNSNSSTALSLGGSASLTALYVGVTGNVSGFYSINSTQGVHTGINPVADP